MYDTNELTLEDAIKLMYCPKIGYVPRYELLKSFRNMEYPPIYSIGVGKVQHFFVDKHYSNGTVEVLFLQILER